MGGAAGRGVAAKPVNRRGMGHRGEEPFGRLDRIVLMRLDLWQLVEHRLWQFALLKIEEPIVSQDETPATLLVGFIALRAGIGPRVSDLIDLPEDHDLAVLALTHRSAELVRLLHGQPEGRDVFCRGKQKQIDAPVRFFRYDVARQSGCAPRPTPGHYPLLQQVYDLLGHDRVGIHRSISFAAPASRRAGRFGSLKTPNLSFPLGLFTLLRGEGGKRPDAERSGANQ